jgi:hypothetical protein
MRWFYYIGIRTLVIIDEMNSHKLHISWGIRPEVWKDAHWLIKKWIFVLAVMLPPRRICGIYSCGMLRGIRW